MSAELANEIERILDAPWEHWRSEQAFYLKLKAIREAVDRSRPSERLFE